MYLACGVLVLPGVFVSRQGAVYLAELGSARTDSRGDVSRLAVAALTANETDCAWQLARFFPTAAAVRVPVQVTALSSSARLREATLVEYYEPQHAIFVSSLPLEFADRVMLECDSRGNAKQAAVVAVQYHGQRKAVAVRFTDGPCTWVMEP